MRSAVFGAPTIWRNPSLTNQLILDVRNSKMFPENIQLTKVITYNA